jgi:phenylpyruvate tautomerase
MLILAGAAGAPLVLDIFFIDHSASGITLLSMPLLKLETTVAVAGEKQKALLAALSKAVGATIGKPEQYVMVTLGSAAIRMSGQDGEAALVDIRSIGGLSADTNRKLARQICQILKDSLGVPPERVYLNFTDVEAGNWGWNGNTFG